jgi:hypothetical protein
MQLPAAVESPASMANDVRELRTVERFVVAEPLLGSFGAAAVALLDICEHGVQIEHAQPLRLATRARLWFKRGEVAASVQAAVVWSRLSKTPNAEGKLLYRSGVAIEGDDGSFADALQMLALRGVVRRDSDSLDRKRQQLLAKESARSGRPIVKIVHPDHEVPGDQLLLVQHARAQLKMNPDEAQKWYNRARFAIDEDGAHFAGDSVRHREEVLAVWEYLERSIDLATIVRIFSRY